MSSGRLATPTSLLVGGDDAGRASRLSRDRPVQPGGAVALSALPPERSGLAAGAISLIGAVGTAGLLLGRRAVAPSAVAVPAADAA